MATDIVLAKPKTISVWGIAMLVLVSGVVLVVACIVEIWLLKPNGALHRFAMMPILDFTLPVIAVGGLGFGMTLIIRSIAGFAG